MFPRFAIYDEPGRDISLILYILRQPAFDLIFGTKRSTPFRPFPASQEREDAYRPSDPQSRSIRLSDGVQV